MPTNHRGTPTGDNHRSTPLSSKIGRRSDLPGLSRALGDLLESNRQSHVEEYNDPEDFQMQHSMARFLPEDAYEKGITHEHAADALRQYRDERDLGTSMDFEQEDIRDAYRTRHDWY